MKHKHPKVGRRVKVIGTDYDGRSGTMFYCNTCCKKYRVQFDNIGNNISLVDIRKLGGHLINLDVNK